MGGINFNPGGGSSFDPANPGAIGGTTPNTGAFTALTVPIGNLGTTTAAGLILVNSTEAAVGAQQASPALVWEGRGWKTNATAASQIVRFRQYVLPVQGSSNPTALWTLQSEINNSGVWVDVMTVSSANIATFTQVNMSATIISGNGIYLNSNVPIRWNSIPFLVADESGRLAQRNGTNEQEFRVYGTFTDSSNYRRLSQGMSTGGVAFLRPEGAGTGASGNVIHISGLPTSNPGPGILWNNGGAVEVGT
jgi:hypothetical protein